MSKKKINIIKKNKNNYNFCGIADLVYFKCF